MSAQPAQQAGEPGVDVDIERKGKASTIAEPPKSPRSDIDTPESLPEEASELCHFLRTWSGGDPLSLKNSKGQMLVHSAAQAGQVDVLRTLAELGADLSVSDENGRSAAHLAAETGNVAVLQVLKELGQDLCRKDAKGIMPVHTVARLGYSEVLWALHELGADVTDKDSKGKTPAHWGAQNGHVNVLQSLKDLRADISVQDRRGKTPAHYAALNDYAEALHALKELGADLSARDNQGETPAKLAAEQGHGEVLQMLWELGEDVRDAAVVVSLISGRRTCIPADRGNQHIRDVKHAAEEKLGVQIARLIRKDGSVLEESARVDTLQLVETITAIVQALGLDLVSVASPNRSVPKSPTTAMLPNEVPAASAPDEAGSAVEFLRCGESAGTR